MEICCSFCGKDEQAVTMLFKSWSEEEGSETPAYICNLCVAQCYQDLHHAAQGFTALAPVDVFLVASKVHEISLHLPGI